MSQLITDKENERFMANTADMTQDDFFVIAILEMCTDPELSKRFREVKTNEFTWEKLRDVAETYERATASDNRDMMVNSNRRSGNTHKARQITDAASPEITDDESSDHKVGRTIVTCSDDYKVYRMTGANEEDQEPTDKVYRTIEGGTRKTSITSALLL